MNQIENLIQFPERGGNITPHKMIAIPLLDFSVWAGNTMDIPDLGENPYSKSIFANYYLHLKVIRKYVLAYFLLKYIPNV